MADDADESPCGRIAETLLANPVIEDFTVRPAEHGNRPRLT